MKKLIFLILAFFCTCTAIGQKASSLHDSYDYQLIEFCSKDLDPIDDDILNSKKIDNINLLKKYKKFSRMEFHKRFYQMFLANYYNGGVFSRYNGKSH